MSDVWSLGVILYILVTAGFPFPGDSVDKLKRAVLGDHLKIPFWVSVGNLISIKMFLYFYIFLECADLIRKMLTVLPIKRYSLTNVMQHRWFICKMPEQIKELLANLPNLNQTNTEISTTVSSFQIDPTVLLFMQQHTGWTESQLIEVFFIKKNFFKFFLLGSCR